MAKKRFEEIEYDPIEAEAKRALARSVSSPTSATNIIPIPQTFGVKKTEESPLRESSIIEEKGRGLVTATMPARKEKKRSFSCASPEQDHELDAFILRVQEAVGTHVPFQVLMRAACVAMLSAEDQLMSELKKIQPPSFPAKFAHAKYAEFEEYWINVLQKAIRKSRAFSST